MPTLRDLFHAFAEAGRYFGKMAADVTAPLS